MAITASGPPFVGHYSTPSLINRELCKCGWMWEDECKKAGECGLNQGMPEYDKRATLHTPYEFLEESVALDKVCREVVEDLVRDSKSTQVGGTHYAEMEVQPWDFYKSIFPPSGYCDYHVGSIISYLSRHRKKGGLQDLEKALHHLKELVRYFKEDEEYE